MGLHSQRALLMQRSSFDHLLQHLPAKTSNAGPIQGGLLVCRAQSTDLAALCAWAMLSCCTQNLERSRGWCCVWRRCTSRPGALAPPASVQMGSCMSGLR